MISEAFKNRIKKAKAEDIVTLQGEIDSMENNLNGPHLNHSDELNKKIWIIKERIKELTSKSNL